MPNPDFEPLLLRNQLCFPLYAAARKVVAAYNPLLKEIGLTYAQYVTMMVLWEERTITMHELGKRLYLDSGTLTPLLKKLEGLDYLKRSRKVEDERVVLIEITDAGIALRAAAQKIPHAMGCVFNAKGEVLTADEVARMKQQLYRIIQALE